METPGVAGVGYRARAPRPGPDRPGQAGRRPRPSDRVPRATVQAIWQAEDGRCESCGRPMDRRCAQVSRRDPLGGWAPANLALLCCDCESRQPGRLRSIAIAPEVLAALPLRPEVGDRLAWTRRLLHARGIYVPLPRWRPPQPPHRHRRLWVPGVGWFLVRRPAGPPPPARPVPQPWSVVAVRLHPAPLRVRPPQPQARTRGLPRPDRGPWQRPR